MAGDDENGNGSKRPLTRSEKFKNYCLGIAALTALLLGTFNILKGEPRAEKAWETLRDQSNVLADTVNKLTKRVIFLQAHESGRTAAQLQLQLDSAERKILKLEELLKGKTTTVTSATATPPPPPPTPTCRSGQALIDGRCRYVQPVVAKRLKEDAAEQAKIRKRLLEEKRKRIEEERRSKKLMQQLTAPHPPAPMKMLPSKLDEAGK